MDISAVIYFTVMSGTLKKVIWVGSSYKDLMDLPERVRRFFGHALFLAQCGEKHQAVKVLKGFGGAGVLEILEHDEGGTYRAVHTVNFTDFVAILHCFQKKKQKRHSNAQSRS